ncbi:MAG: DMT family transporter [Caldilineaceae bacterium]|nr:DMT family transporter [Caldilineaceae bacterium]
MSLQPDPRPLSESRGLYLVALAVLFFSTSPILTRWAAQSLTAFEISAGRMLTAGLAVLAIALLRHEPLPRGRAWLRFLGYGLVAALHFGCYIASLNYTTIAHSLAITYTAPIFVALFSAWFLGEGMAPRRWLGTLVAVAGVAILAGFEPAFTPRMALGDGLAWGSAICFGLYSIAGRSQRRHYGLFAYAGSVYALAGLWLLPLALLNFSSNGYTATAITSVLALGLLPLALGHTLYNAALRRTRATAVNLIATQEVTGGILLGMLFLGEFPTPTSLVGVAITLLGIVFVIL